MNLNYFMLSVGLFFAGTLCVIAQEIGPSRDYQIQSEPTSVSPDGTTTIEQYAKIASDGSYTWQFWARHKGKLSLLKPEQPDYAAGFRFTNDSQWLVRMQKTGAGYASLYLYHLGPTGFVTATSKPLSDLAWDYFQSLPDSKKIGMPDFHVTAGLVAGTDDDYRSMGEKWPNSQYLVIYLAGGISSDDQHGQVRTLTGWRCRYDLLKGIFDLPPDLKANNVKVIAAKSN